LGNPKTFFQKGFWWGLGQSPNVLGRGLGQSPNASARNPQQNKKGLPRPIGHAESFFCCIDLDLKKSSLNVKNLLAVVEAAHLAYAVGLNHLVALGVGALHETAGLQLGVVGSSGISASLGNFTLWYCHIDTSSWALLNI
jgi:hypothetical protein